MLLLRVPSLGTAITSCIKPPIIIIKPCPPCINLHAITHKANHFYLLILFLTDTCSSQLMLKSLFVLLLTVAATKVPRLIQSALHCYHLTLTHLTIRKLLLQCVFHFSSLFLSFLLENLLCFLFSERASEA